MREKETKLYIPKNKNKITVNILRKKFSKF